MGSARGRKISEQANKPHQKSGHTFTMTALTVYTTASSRGGVAPVSAHVPMICSPLPRAAIYAGLRWVPVLGWLTSSCSLPRL